MKIPESVLVVVCTPACRVLLLERADHPGFWQSVTGSREPADAGLRETCLRELAEETGLDARAGCLQDWQTTHRYPIYPNWRARYAPGVTHNTEHVFGFVVPREFEVALAPEEHLRYRWLDWREAAECCFSWTNVAAIREVPRRLQCAGPR